MCKLANDSMPYAIRTSIEYWWGIVTLEDISKQLFQWFSDNQLKENPEKCQLICSTDEQISGGNLVHASVDFAKSMYYMLYIYSLHIFMLLFIVFNIMFFLFLKNIYYS